MAFEDNELAGFEKQIVLLQNLYLEIPDDVKAAATQAIKFLDGGKESAEGEEETENPRVFSFSKDADLIFAAFKQTHGIDLQEVEYMHWWKFMALFMDLGSETTFCNLVSLRKRVKTGKATKEERQAAREMGDLFELPEIDERTLEEKEAEAEFMRLLGKGGK